MPLLGRGTGAAAATTKPGEDTGAAAEPGAGCRAVVGGTDHRKKGATAGVGVVAGARSCVAAGRASAAFGACTSTTAKVRATWVSTAIIA